MTRSLAVTLIVLVLALIVIFATVRTNTTDVAATVGTPGPLASEVLLQVGDSVTVDGDGCVLVTRGKAPQVIVSCEALRPGEPTEVPVFVATPGPTP